MTETDIICTVVPNGRDKGKLYFSVFLSPRIYSSTALKNLKQIWEWEKYSEIFTDNSRLKVRFGRLETLDGKLQVKGEELPYEIKFEDKRLNKIKNLVSSKSLSLWSSLFQDTNVEKWVDGQEVEVSNLHPMVNPAELEERSGFAKSTFGFFSDEVVKNIAESENIRDLENATYDFEDTIENNKKNQEFHKKMSYLSSYPDLLRLMGWIFDFSVYIGDNDSIASYQLIKLDISGFNSKSEPSSLKNEQYEEFKRYVGFITPWSNFNADDFSLKYKEGLKYYHIEKGFVNPKVDNSYVIRALQTDLKEVIKNYNIREGESSPYTNDLLSSSGIGLLVLPIKAASGDPVSTPLIFAISNSPDKSNNEEIIYEREAAKDENLLSNYVLFGHHLDTGYWIDVVEVLQKVGESYTYKMDGDRINFKSLCKRTADYVIDKSSNPETLIKNFKDEPWIAESAQEGTSGKIYYDLELCRWNNWSLTCPQVGNYPQDEEEDVDAYFNDLELNNIRPQEYSLLPLRFGKWYGFRIRVADLCGNGKLEVDKLPLKEGVEDPSIIINSSDAYKRYERVNPPELHFIKEQGSNQSLETLVVKTKVFDGNLIYEGDCERIISPPRANFQFVEIHGVLDDLFLSSNYENTIYEKAFPQPSSTEQYIVQKEIPYLTDPCCKGYKIVFENFTTNDNTLNINEWNTCGKGYIERKFSFIRIDGNNIDEENIRTINGGVLANIKPGSLYTISIQSDISLNPSKTYKHIESGNDLNIFHEVVQNKITTPKKLQVIHAVQKPVVTRKGSLPVYFSERFTMKAAVFERTPDSIQNGDQSVSFRVLIFGYPVSLSGLPVSDVGCFPVSTSAEFRLIGEYDEWVTNFEKEEGYEIKNRTFQKVFSNLLENTTITSTNNGDAEDNNEVVKTSRDEHKLKFNDDYDENRLFLEAFENFKHTFGDTKHREVKYRIEAVSRFRDYFPDLTDFSVSGLLEGGKAINIKSSAMPDAPVIKEIVQVFDWIGKGDDFTIERRHHTFRIYFDGGWYSSGKGEKVAVLFLDKESSIDDSFEGLVSEYGKDPTTENSPTNGLYTNFFQTERIVGAATDDVIFHQLLGRSIGVQNLSEPEKRVLGAIYDVAFEKLTKDEGRFYCDIKLNLSNETDKYFPFLKLAICRYQANSIFVKGKYDFRFSPVVMAPQVQILPKRKLSWSKNYKRISVEGLSSKGNNEFYIFLEKIFFEGDVTPVSAKVIKWSKPKEELNLDSFISKEYNLLTVEEYEYYDVGPTDFSLVEDNEYNPRNDIRKRLVFSYQIDMKNTNEGEVDI